MTTNKDKDDNQQHSSSGRGFASMDEDKQREIASKGGKAAHEKGTAHEFDSDEAREAGKAAHEKGTAHEFDSEEAREAGRKGGKAAHENNAREAGSKGGHSGSGSSTRGGTSEQHAKAGSQSHKNK
ncbi:KGG domain-containing protein [Nitrosomonas sp. Nm166]|uniref:KGG domain-containing protein n=1 Tax=Nitrosomonas sp. Nm166 TaxID=1881054 RepID=UPI0008DEBCA4|nr:KGG domain-containing protein [Nitrosomonas sp. Nm166]SFE12608.1 hypothetical protein SAMN05428977_100750 [Nitrosomonas sp. Nm166]